MCINDWNIEQLERMSGDEERRFWRKFEKHLRLNDGDAAMKSLQAGNPIYYADTRFPGYVVRKWPDGTCELVKFDVVEGMTIIRRL